ncbi:MAG: hypothetical protein DRJ65_22555 [Acidobacteria bacterium]|nr:MAG: hypothetical protein DRJ65_22555 [Acidobacteriota bacterium]
MPGTRRFEGLGALEGWSPASAVRSLTAPRSPQSRLPHPVPCVGMETILRSVDGTQLTTDVLGIEQELRPTSLERSMLES